MADNAKILGQILGTNTDLDYAGTTTIADALFLYRVPRPTQAISTATPKSAVFPIRTIISSLIVCNTHSSALTYDLALIADSSIDSDNLVTGNLKQSIISARSLDAKATDVIGLGVTLSGGDAIYAWAENPDKVTFNLFGFEIS